MSISITASATAPSKVRTDVLAVPIFEGGVLGAGGDVVQAQLNGTLERYLTGNGYEAKPVQTIAVPVTNGGGPGVVVLVGLGSREQVTAEKRAKVNEEMHLHKRAVTENQQVSDTVRKERVNVDGVDEQGNVPLDASDQDTLTNNP